MSIRDALDAARCRFYRWRFRRWLAAPAGCCACGTGGPYYQGGELPVTRYLYDAATAGIAWSACSKHQLVGVQPLVDYGSDVVVSSAQVEADMGDALTQAGRHGPLGGLS